MLAMSEVLNPAELRRGSVYRLCSRTLALGIFDGTREARCEAGLCAPWRKTLASVRSARTVEGIAKGDTPASNCSGIVLCLGLSVQLKKHK